MAYFDLCQVEKYCPLNNYTCSESCGTDGYCRFIITDLYSPVRGVVVAAARVTWREVGHAVTPTHRVVLLHVTAAVRDTHARQVTAAALRPVEME